MTTSHFKIGSFVKIHSLVNAPHFNGQVAIIVNAQNKDQRWGIKLLDHGPGWQDDKTQKFGGKQLAVKQSNLSPSTDSPLWKSPSIGGGHSVLEYILSRPQLAHEEYCHLFCQCLWSSFFETIPGAPLMFSGRMDFRSELLHQATGHKLYWLSLDAVQHYLMIEKCHGRFRVFQSHVKILEGVGYTAQEWCTLDSLDAADNTAHKAIGGGLTVGDDEMSELLTTMEHLQKLTKSLIPHLLKHAPLPDPSAANLLVKNPTTLSNLEMEKATEALQHAASWSNEIQQLVGPLGITTLDDDMADPVVILQGNAVLFEIPQKLYQRVRKLNQNLTGVTFLSPVVFVHMVNHGIWWEHRQSPLDGGGIGFTVRGASLDIVQTYEEGLQAAQDKSAKVREMFGN